MTDPERLQLLRQLKGEFQADILRFGAPFPPTYFDPLLPALDFNEQYYQNAQSSAAALTEVRHEKAEYEKAATELNMIVGQAITELEHGQEPPPPEVLEAN